MSYSVQLSGSVKLTNYEFPETQVPSAGQAVNVQQSCYSYVNQISGLTNPVSLQHDVMYANAFAAIIDQKDLFENETPLALGCVGHQIDKEFPLESKTEFPLPLVMYPTTTNGNSLHEVDMCAIPVLNWEAYMHDLKTVTGGKVTKSRNNRSSGNSVSEECVPQVHNLDSIPEEPRDDMSDESDSSSDQDPPQPTSIPHLNEEETHFVEGNQKKKIVYTKRTKRLLLAQQEESHDRKTLEHSNLRKIKKMGVSVKERQSETLAGSLPHPEQNKEKLNMCFHKKLQNQPKLRIEGTWNHLYGGYAGACCFMKTGPMKKLYLYMGKGSQLRAVKLDKANPSSIFSYKIEAVWEEDEVNIPVKILGNASDDPFDELVFQLVPNEYDELLGVRRGRSIQIYDTQCETPVFLESVPNVLYGTKEYYPNLQYQRKSYSQNPLLCGFDFNPTFGQEIITIDENEDIRVCNIYQRSTSDVFALPNTRQHIHAPPDYPVFQFNAATGVTFTNHGQLFYAWGDSTVYLGDRRPTKYSRAHIFPLFDLRKHVYSLALTSQIHFHDSKMKLYEFVSCVKRSKRDNYYYVGTTSKIYLMDYRIPNHPVIAVSHGLQSPLTYMNTLSAEGESFETIVAGSQRSPEFVCMITDLVHLECHKRPGCTRRGPLLHCYPKHLLNSRQYFDQAVNAEHGFEFPMDHELVKDHFYAWSTGLAVYPLTSNCAGKLPGGFIAVNSNNFGDVFWQEWDQKPLPLHRKIRSPDYKLSMFVSKWHKAMKTNISSSIKPKPSNNPYNPVDCTIFLEPLVKGIEELNRVRDSPFDCFNPNQLQNHSCLEAMIPTEDLFCKLTKYKNPAVKGILDVWRARKVPKSVDLCEMEQVEIKLEPTVGALSPMSTVDLDLDYEIETHAEEQRQISQLERDVQNSLNTDPNDFDFENFDFIQNNQFTEHQSENYSNMFENSQPFNLDDYNDHESQDMHSTQQPSSSSFRQVVFKNAKKSRKSGFL